MPSPIDRGGKIKRALLLLATTGVAALLAGGVLAGVARAGGCEPESGTEIAEPNDTRPTFFSSLCGGTKTGTIHKPDDVDYYAPRATQPGKELKVTLEVPAGRDYDAQIVTGLNGTVLAWNHRGPGETEQVSFKNENNFNQQYYVKVFSFDGSFSTTAQYTVTVGKSF